MAPCLSSGVHLVSVWLSVLYASLRIDLCPSKCYLSEVGSSGGRGTTYAWGSGDYPLYLYYGCLFLPMRGDTGLFGAHDV